MVMRLPVESLLSLSWMWRANQKKDDLWKAAAAPCRKATESKKLYAETAKLETTGCLRKKPFQSPEPVLLYSLFKPTQHEIVQSSRK